jgi:hypothetical protein
MRILVTESDPGHSAAIESTLVAVRVVGAARQVARGTRTLDVGLADHQDPT